MGTAGRPTYRHATKQLLTPLLPVLPTAHRWRRQVARERFIIRVKTAALAVGASVDLEVGSDVIVDGLPFVEIYANTWNTLHIGAGCRIGDGVRLSLRGGRLEVGRDTELRRLGTYQLAGDARIGNGVLMSTGLVLHCADSIEVGDLTITGEYVTITDSDHLRTPPGVPIKHQVETMPVHIGCNAWLGAHSVITSGVTVGDQAIVAAGAVVTTDVAPGWLVGGVPARPIHEL